MKRYRDLSVLEVLMLICVCSLLVACGTSQAGVEHTPTPRVTAVPMATGTLPAAETSTPQSGPIQTATAPAPATVLGDQLLGLVYRLEDAVWLVDADGRPVHVSDDPRIFLSPDGSQLVRCNPDDQEYWLIDRVTGAERNLTRMPRRWECCFRWWPTRPGTVLFNSIDPAGGPAGVSPAPMGFLTAVNVDGTEYKILDTEHDVGPGAIAPSPDGQTIAYGGGRTGWLYHWDTGAEVFDPFEYGLTGVSNPRLGGPAWSPDGTKLAWVIGGQFGDGIARRVALVVFDLPERTARLLHPYYHTQKGVWPPAPDWSPDGRWLAFEAWARDADEDGVWVVQVDEEQEHYLGQGSYPVWSPDGRKLAFNRTARDVEIGIFVTDVDVWEPYPLDLLPSAYLKGWVDVVPAAPEAKAEGTVSAEGRDSPLPDSCLVDGEGSALFVNRIDGYCLRYPARFRVGDVYPPGIANLYGPPHDKTLEPVMAASTIRVVEPVQSLALADAVDWWLQREGIQSATGQSDVRLGGEPAEAAEGLGERSGVRVIIALHDGKLYALSFYPVDERFPQAAPDVEELWEIVTRSFGSLSPETQAGLDGIAEPDPEPTSAPPQLSFESTTYRDELAGFEFDHPRSWTLGYQEKQARGRIVQLCAQSLDLPRIQVAVMLWEPNDLDGYASRWQQAWLASGSTILSREEGMFTGDHRATRYLVQALSGERVFFFVTTIGDRYLVLSGSGDLDLLAEVARTVRLFDPTVERIAEHQKWTGMCRATRAREALQRYFSLLHNGRYAEAVSYYGGHYEVLREWNPSISRDDHAGLFENGCRVNGLQCLAVKAVVREQKVSAEEYLFTVEFTDNDGSTFTRKPPTAQFDCTVRKVDG